MWQNTSEGDGGANERVKFFITANRKLEVAWGNALDLEILRRILSPNS